MQPIDPADKRRPHVQIAASIRAAILTGELAPGSQLAPGHELADFFGVSRMTVQTAIRTLRDEGFVRSRAGSGVYVRDQASLPVPEDETHPLAGAADYLYEAGRLKQLHRAGWELLAVPAPESVAEHSFRVGLVGLILAAIEGADPGRVAALGLVHDVHEARIGDVPSVGRAYVTTAVPEAVSAHQAAGMPPAARDTVRELVAEFEAAQTAESRVAHDADKLETLLQAREYEAQGHRTAAWQESAVAALRTDAGRELARAILATDPHHWWSAYAASYVELRAETVERARRQHEAARQS